MEKHCIGIDVDKKTLKACLSHQHEGRNKVISSRTFPNDKGGFADLQVWVGKKVSAKTIYVMEATGVYHEYLAYYLQADGQQVHIVLPLKSKRYLQSMGIRSKTDKIDAKGLSFMGLEQSLEKWEPASKHLMELRSITRQLEMLQEHKTSFKNQLEGAKHSAVMHPSVLKSLEKMIKELENEAAKLEKQVRLLVEKDAVLKEKYKLFESLKGVGLLSFAVVVSETNGFALFKNQRQLVCYSGYDVLENQSGQKTGKSRISKKGNTHIRRILHLAAWSVVKNKTRPFYQLYERVYERTGVKMKAYVAVQRKLLVMIYTLWKRNEPFDPDFGISGIHESKPLFSVDPTGSEKETDDPKGPSALDGLPCNQSPEALFSVIQI